MSPTKSLGKQGYFLTMARGGWCQVWDSFSIFRDAGQIVSCPDPVPAGLLMDYGWERLKPSYRTISEYTVGSVLVGLSSGSPGPWLKGTGAGSQATSESTAWKKVHVTITQGMCECDSSQVLSHVVLVTGTKPNRAVTESYLDYKPPIWIPKLP